jgi:predicted DCC family thiol-disulfide oxidoreductase YuxK
MEHPVILFDGVCNLCSSSVQFVIRHDPRHYFRFASLQSDFGQSVLQQHHLPVQKLGSFVLLEDGKVYTRSTAVLRVCKKLNGAWPLLYAFLIVPPFIRNAVYDFIANRRYKWFGKKEACWVPRPELQQLFLS